MKTLFQTIARVIVDRLLTANPRIPASRIAWIVAFAVAGAVAGRAGFGTYWLPGDHGHLLAFWHGPIMWIGAWIFVSVYNAHSLVTGRMGKSSSQATLIFVLAPGYYITLLAIATIFFTLWTVPVWIVWQLIATALVFVRPNLVDLQRRLGPLHPVRTSGPIPIRRVN